MADTHKVRTTFRPDVEIEVGDAEYVDLLAQGVLTRLKSDTSEGAPTAPETLPTPDTKLKKENTK